MREIAFFDFDGTITHKDSMLDFIIHTASAGKILGGVFYTLPILLLYKLGLIKNDAAKKMVLKFYYGGMKKEKFDALVRGWASTRLEGLVRSAAREHLQDLGARGVKIVIVSASLKDLLQDWARARGYDLLASEFSFSGGVFTGEYIGKNCWGNEKVAKIRSHYDLSKYDKIYAYGDTKGDLPMLALAHEPHYKPFREKKDG